VLPTDLLVVPQTVLLGLSPTDLQGAPQTVRQDFASKNDKDEDDVLQKLIGKDEEMIGVNVVRKSHVDRLLRWRMLRRRRRDSICRNPCLPISQMSLFSTSVPHPPLPPPLPQSQTLTDPRSISIRRSER
jgi:hypothetical protein